MFSALALDSRKYLIMDQYLNILLVDDDPDDHLIFRSALKDVYLDDFRVADIVKVLSIYNGALCIDYLLKKGFYRSTKDPLPDIIVLDLNMPLVDGFAVVHEMQKHPELKKIPVYVLTTSRDEETKNKCAQLKCAGFYSKPATRIELKNIIEKMIQVFSD
jgi:two-component system response regulator